MADFDVSAGCIDLSVDASLTGLSVIFPGGATLEIPSPPGVDVAFAIDYAKQFLAAINAALMPITPIFNIIDTVMAIVDFCQAIPDAITGLDPSKLLKAIPKILAKLDKLLAMIPPLSFPIMIKSIIGVIVVMLTGLKAALQTIVDFLRGVAIANERVAVVAAVSLEASIQLQASIACAQASASASMGGLAQGLKPIDSLLNLISLFVQMAGLPIKIPTLEQLGDEAEVAVEIVGLLITVLGTVHAAIVI